MYNRGLIFDNVGVLSDDPLMDLSWLAGKYGLDPGRLNAAKNNLWVKRYSVDPGMTYQDFWSEVLDEIGSEYDQNMITEMNDDVMKAHEPRERMLEYVKGLSERDDVRLLLWTNVSRDWYSSFNARLGLDEIFDHLALSFLYGTRKEDPSMVKMSISYLRRDGCSWIAGVDDQRKNASALIDNGVNKAVLHTEDDTTISILNDFIGED